MKGDYKPQAKHKPQPLLKLLVFVEGFLHQTKEMGLSNFTSAAEGVLPVLVMNTVLSVALLKNMMRSVLQIVGVGGNSSTLVGRRSRWVPRKLKGKDNFNYPIQILCQNRSNTVNRGKSRIAGGTCGSGSPSGWATVECCACLCGFEADEVFTELSCKHFFYKNCLEKWFDNKHSTCPLLSLFCPVC
ncbi:RING zinc finger protein [Quillaja saponaria]|uniref:RING zinc finger protein n=1 Tax=Quillaja saponaria TaxID=32244 RepID=A0AAD7P7Q7_QUISA|nr:RING zinc finger protein [Quillaja saponaria]